MLSTPAPFPHVGAAAYLKPQAEPVRILRRNPDHTALIQFTDPARLDAKIASGNKTVPLADLAETHEQAFTANDTKRAKPVRRRPPTAAALRKQCDKFNERCPIGTAVRVRRDDGAVVETVTRSSAEVLSGHSAVIWLEGIGGCYLLDRVTPIAQAGR